MGYGEIEKQKNNERRKDVAQHGKEQKNERQQNKEQEKQNEWHDVT